MNSKAKERIKRIREMPSRIAEVYNDDGMFQKLETLMRKNGLRVDQMGVVAEELSKMMLGEIHPKNFSENIKSATRLSKEQTDSIVSDINEQIINPIREDLISSYGRRGNPEKKMSDRHPEAGGGLKKSDILKEVEKESTKQPVVPTPEESAPTQVVPKMLESVMEKQPHAPNSEENFVKSKLEKIIHVPGEKIGGSKKLKKIPLKKLKYSGNDPYRESVE